MEKEVVAAIIGGAATVAAAIIGLANLIRRKTSDKDRAQPNQLVCGIVERSGDCTGRNFTSSFDNDQTGTKTF